MAKVLLVGLGGFLGSIARYWLSGLAHARFGAGFPWGTLAVNVLGCLAIGALSQVVEQRGGLAPELRALLVVGFLGGFTTFSAFGNETVDLFRSDERAVAWSNIAAQLVLTLGAVWLGRIGVECWLRR
jgi:CrcB protein